MKRLYSYQKRVHTLVKKALCDIGIALMVMAPGLGKTVVASFLLKSIHEQKQKVLFLCHDNYILAQARKEFEETFDPYGKLKFYNFFGSLKKIKEAQKADVVFASFQSLNSRTQWYRYFKRNHFAIVIVDEGHHAHAPTFKEVIKYFKPEKALCMTGTPDRGDELDIRDLYGEEVVSIPIEEGIAKGWLTDVEYHVLSDGLDKEALERLFVEVVDEKRKISLAQINKQLFVKKRDEEQVKIIKKFTKNWKKKCIIFCENIHHVRSFSRNLEKGTYYTFHSENTTRTNDKNLEGFKNGNKNVIVCVDKFNEGIDIPDVEVIVFIRATESGIVYRQQLGRGLRKMLGKKKVIVLDFVANIRRILMIQGMVKTIQRYKGPVGKDKSLLSVTGSHYSFDFADELEKITEILKVARIGFYKTWQEASVAAIKLGIKTSQEYRRRHKEDRQLPSLPDQVYEDFPGMRVFLGGTAKNFYPTWQQAAKAAQVLGIKGGPDYDRLYKKDPRLVSIPHKYYADFPGWTVFFGNEVKYFYSTWRQASKATLRLGITTNRQYMKKYKKDKSLPSNPQNTYADFPGWTVFLGRKPKQKIYKTWQQAGRAARKLGLKTSIAYRDRGKYKKDPRLPSNPESVYKDFPGYTVFFGGKEKVESYKTWRQASRAAVALGIHSLPDYYRLYKKDPKLPSTPHQRYADFPGYTKFLAVKKQKKYKTWQEAGIAAKKLSITSWDSYRAKYKSNSMLPGNPPAYYKNFPTWPKFLGKR